MDKSASALPKRCGRGWWLSVALAVLPGGMAGQGDRVVSGRVMSAVDSSGLARVTVSSPASVSVLTDPTGRFSIRVATGSVQLTFRRLGLVTRRLPVGTGDNDLSVYLPSTAVRIAPLRAEAAFVARERFETLAQPSIVSLNPAEVTGVPALLEPDVVRAVQLLPGTVTKNDFTTGFNVRGGESDQNLILLDGGLIFNPFHLGGIFSTFDAAAVDRIDFITGGYSAEYGGRLSSVLDIGLRDGRTDRVHVSGLVSPISSSALVEGPIGRSGASYLISGRRTYADLVVGAFSNEDLPYYFADALTRITIPAFGGTFTATGYWGTDDLDWPWIDAAADRDPVNIQFRWGNRLAALNYERALGPGTLLAHASLSGFKTRLALAPDLFGADNDVSAATARVLWTASAGGHDLRMGLGVDDYRMQYDIGSTALDADFFTARYEPRVWSAFVDDQWRPVSWLFIRPGVRVEHVPGSGFTGVAPRSAIKVFLDDETALTGSVGRYYQAIHSLRDPDVPYTIFDFWIGTDRATPVASSDHLVVGAERWVTRDLSVTVEGYRKTFDNLVIRNRNQDPKVPGDEFVPTQGDAWGVDVLIRKHQGTVRGWVAYGYLQAERRAQGRVFPPAHDRRHSLNVVGFLPGPLGSEMSVRWGYGSPLPYTGFAGAWSHRSYNAATHAFDGFEEEVLASDVLNGERYPPYSRLDLSFRWTKRAWGGLLRPYFQVVNAYNRTNVFVYLFDYQDSPATRTGISQFPIFPSFGLEFEF